MSKNSPVLMIFAGPNGAGKSTLREVLRHEFDFGVEIDPDEIAKARELSDIQAGRETVRLVEQYIRQGVSFSLETTLSGNLIFKQMQQAKENGFQIRLLFVSLDSPEKHLDRIEQRVVEGGHNITPDDVMRRYYRSLENLSKAISLVDEAEVFTNVAEFETIARFDHGKIVERAARAPAWANRILNQYYDRVAMPTNKSGSNRTRVCSSRCQTSSAPASKCKCVCGGENHGTKQKGR